MQLLHSKKAAFVISMLFNGYWLLCVVVQEQAFLVIGALLALAILADKKTLVVAPVITMIGVMGDVLLTHYQVFIFPEKNLHGFVAESSWLSSEVASFPLWLFFLWLGFASHAWLLRAVILKTPRWLLVALCAVSGPLSYYAGYELGAVNFSETIVTTLLILFLLWAFYGWLFAVLIQFFSEKVFKELDLNFQSSDKAIFL